MRRAAAVLLVASAATMLGACSREELSPLAADGRRVYLANCVSCHNVDPALDGPVGPAVKGSSAELLRSRVVTGTYPAGYTPKRPTKVMQPMPQLANDMAALAEYLR